MNCKPIIVVFARRQLNNLSTKVCISTKIRKNKFKNQGLQFSSWFQSWETPVLAYGANISMCPAESFFSVETFCLCRKTSWNWLRNSLFTLWEWPVAFSRKNRFLFWFSVSYWCGKFRSRFRDNKLITSIKLIFIWQIQDDLRQINQFRKESKSGGFSSWTSSSSTTTSSYLGGGGECWHSGVLMGSFSYLKR